MTHLHDQLLGDEAMYKENILEHYREPSNAGKLEDAAFSHKELNTTCGDTIEFFVRLDDPALGDAARVTAVRFDGSGCAISQASVSMLTEYVQGMTVAQLRALTKDDVWKYLGFEVGMTRMRCALLGLKTLELGLAKHLTA